MAQYLISDTYLTNIANAIRGKLNVSTTYTPGEMSGAINSIQVATAPSLQSKTVTPQEYQQIIAADNTYDGLGSVTISAISSTYVGSGVTRVNATTIAPTSAEQTAVAANRYTNGIIKVSAVPTETKSITTNGTYTPSTGKWFSSVIVNVPTGSTINNQNKTVTPTESSQDITADSGYTGLGTVTVSAIPSNYIGSGITTQGAKTVTPTTSAQTAVASGVYTTGAINVAAIQTQTRDITANGTYTPSSGKYFSSVTVNVPTGSTISNQNKTVTPSETQQSITADSSYTGLGTVTVNAISSTYVGSGIARRAAATITPTTTNQSIAANTYLTGKQTISGDANLVAGNIKSGVSIFGVSGSYTGSSGSAPNLQAKINITPTESSQTITADSGYDGLSSVQINAISSTYVGSEVDRQSAADLVIAGNTVTAPAGYYDSDASTSVTTMNLPTAAASSRSGTTKATINRSTSAQYINIPIGYNSAAASYTISATPNMTLPTTASTSSSGTAKLTITPTTSNRYLNIPTGYNGTASYYTIKGDSNLLAANIKSGVSIFGVAGSYTAPASLDTSDATATATDILNTKTAYVNGTKITGSMTNNGATGGTITTQGGTYTIPAGYTSGGTVTASLTATTLTNSIISGSAYAEATGDYAWRSTVQIPAGYHNATTLTKDFSSIFPAPDTPATASQILLNYQAYDKDGKLITGTMTNNSVGTITLNQTTTSYTIPAGYHNGTGKVQHTTVNIPDPTITVSSSGLITASGSWTRGFTTDNSYSKTQQLTTKAATTYMPGTTNQTIASGTYLTGTQTISGDANLVASNIISGKSIFGVNGSVVINKFYTGSSAPSSSLGSNGDIYLQE